MVKLKEQIGDIITLGVENREDVIYKGYMMAQNGKDTEFTSKLSLNIGYSELMDKLTFKDETSYEDENSNKFTSNAIYKYTKIEKENLMQILGEDGYINIINKSGEIISTLNKDNLSYNYEGEIANIVFETSKPISEGILEIENGRAIKSAEYSGSQINNFTKYNVGLKVSAQKDGQDIINGTYASQILLENQITEANLTLSEDRLGTVAVNEGIEIRVTLKTTDARNMLYKNPVLEIVFPSYITNVKVDNVKLVYEKELKIKEAIISKNASRKHRT